MKKGFQTKVTSPTGEVFKVDSWKHDDKNQQRIPFYWNFDETSSPNIGKVTLTNITNRQIEEFQDRKELRLQMGWLPQGKNDQLIMKGTILNTKTTHMSNRTTHATDITFRDTPLSYHTQYVSRSWSKGVSASQVLKDLIQDEIGTTFSLFKPNREIIYRRGKSFYGSLIKAIQQVASTLRSKFFFFNRRPYLLPPISTLPQPIELQEQDIVQGLSSKKDKEKEITCFLNTRIKPSSKVKLNTEQTQGQFRVFSGKHHSPNGKRFRTEIQGVQL